MSHVCIWGASLNKVDDEAQVVAITSLVKGLSPSIRITFFSQYGQRLVDLLAKEGIEVSVITQPHFGRVANAMKNADLLLIIGGVFFESPMQALMCATLVAMAKTYRCSVVAWQVSIFPYTTRWGEFVYKTIFDQMDLICVREPVAAEILARMGVARPIKTFADSRLTLEPCSTAEVQHILEKEGIDPDQPLIGVSTRNVHAQMPAWVRRTHHYDDQTADRSNDALARVVAHLEKLAQLIVIPMHPTYEEDLLTFASISRNAGRWGHVKLLSHRYSAREVTGIIAHCHLLLACRLGSAVLAASRGTPIVAIAYETRMLDHMRRVGLGDFAFDWRDLNPDAIIAAADKVWTALRLDSDSAKVASLKLSARASADALRPYLFSQSAARANDG
jgi:polysaccharide pyruvyl transferase WcaK-like protein